MTARKSMLFLAAVLLITCAGSSNAQELAPGTPDPIEQLHLTPDQRRRIRMIFEETKNERQSINRRVREANVALDQALDAEPADETVIDQRLNELATAQAAQMRMRIYTELKIRRELRPEQLAMLRQLRLQVRDFVNGQRPLNPRPRNPQRRNIPRQP
ncbi:MAG TPA: periplasmic heavy metal sensor [Pyrinomonadaceae bacterium]|nr:periplasmic heavy metal sensor [Pyrinomonadaceae bacterium]